MKQFKLSCCGALVYKVPYSCRACGSSSFFQHPIGPRELSFGYELDKKDRVLMSEDSALKFGFSGDKKEEVRPWGSFENLLDEEGYKVKRIVVNPNQRLSLQLHLHRDEHWHILSGVGEMQVGQTTWTVCGGHFVDIAKLKAHRITNEGDVPLVILEVQTGVCKEDDIFRIQDDYGRIR